MTNQKDLFISQIIQSNQVWALKSKAGFATSQSTTFEDEEGEAVTTICFWSDKKSANTAKKKFWKNFIPTTINLSDFLENWCVQSYNEDLIILLNLNEKKNGLEVNPLALLIDSIEAIKNASQPIEMTFKTFVDFEELESKTKAIWEAYQKETE